MTTFLEENWFGFLEIMKMIYLPPFNIRLEFSLSNQLTSQKIFGAFIGTCKIDSNSIFDVSLAQPFTIPSHLKNQANRVEELDV